MIRSLALRKSFAGIELILLALLAWVVFLLVREIVRQDTAQVVAPFVDTNTADLAGIFAEVQERAAYDKIVETGLFGAAAKFKPNAEAVPQQPIETPSEIAADTKLPLSLRGLTSAGPNDFLASAIIEVREKGTKTKTFYIDEAIMDRVYLRKVQQDGVILENMRANRMEQLMMERRDRAGTPRPNLSRALPTTARAGTRRGLQNLITLDRDDIVKQINEDYARLASTVNVEVVKDDKGRVQGLTTSNIEDIAVAQQLGLKNGDILTSVNNEPVDSVEKAQQVVEKYRNASTFRIGILRDGRQQFITYRLR